MILFYQHRVNSIEALEATAPGLGIEFDLRSDGDRIVVTHDPFTDGPTLEEFLPHVGQRPCIFNVKCEGIEERTIALADANGVKDFFFLDLSIPAAAKLARKGERRIAMRYSELEPAEFAMAWAGKATWLWVDCFTRFPVQGESAAADTTWTTLANAFRLCLVSPELQGHTGPAAAALRADLGDRRFDAACGKNRGWWGLP